MSLFRVLEIKDGWYTIAAIIWTDDPSAWVYYASGKALGWLECEPEFDEIVIYV
jgi:hypothetical protein